MFCGQQNERISFIIKRTDFTTETRSINDDVTRLISEK